MRTKAIPARSWIAACSKAIRIACWRAWRSPAYAVGASQGYIYVRAEYPLAIKRLQDRHSRGATGWACWAARFAAPRSVFDIEIRIGAGAFVCGEETALIASIEGERGTPRPRPPYPAQAGLWDMPTLINNVETFANIPPIMRNGGDWFAAHRHRRRARAPRCSRSRDKSRTPA